MDKFCFAGSDSEWDDLNWTFRIYDSDTFSAKVFSGKATDFKFIGEAFISAKDFVSIPSKENGQMAVSAPIYDSSLTREVSGYIEIQLFIERGQEWDWHVFDFQMKDQKEIQKKALMKKYSKTLRQRQTQPIVYPLGISILSISVFDLKKVHVLRQNRAYVVFNCGSVTRRVEEHDDIELSESGCESWDDLGWNAQLVSETSNVIFIAYSGTTLIGRFSISCEELLKLQRSKNNDIELHGDFYSGSELTGKLRVFLNLKIKYSGRRNKRNINDADEQMRVRLPCLCEIHSAVVEEFSLSNYILSALPSLRATCDHWSQDSQKPIASQLQRDTLLYDELSWEFPVTEKSTIRVFLMDKSKKEVGYLSMKGTELTDCFKNANGKISLKRDFFNGKTKCGILSLEISIKHEGDLPVINESIAVLNAMVSNGPLISGYSHMPTDVSIDRYKSDSIDRTRTKALSVEESTAMLKNSLGVNDDMLSFRMIVTDIVAADLQSVHFLSKNSPYVNIACGGTSHSTSIVVGAGKAASWHGLSFIFFVRMVDAVRIAAWSNISSIGVKEVRLPQLLECSADANGCRELLINISNSSNKISGKVALTFSMDVFDSFSVPADLEGVITPQKLVPPIMVTIFTIALVNLKSVHFMQKNSPIVKLVCDDKRESTGILELAGSNAKWEKLVWSFEMNSNSKVKLVVMSSSIRIGFISFSCDDILEQVPDKNGLSEIEGLLRSEGQPTGVDIGRIRITFSKEPHMTSDTESEYSSEETDISADEMTKRETETAESQMISSNKGVSSRKRRRVENVLNKTYGKITINGLFAKDLKAVHAMAFNSPFIKIKCDNFQAETEVLYSNFLLLCYIVKNY